MKTFPEIAARFADKPTFNFAYVGGDDTWLRKLLEAQGLTDGAYLLFDAGADAFDKVPEPVLHEKITPRSYSGAAVVVWELPSATSDSSFSQLLAMLRAARRVRQTIHYIACDKPIPQTWAQFVGTVDARIVGVGTRTEFAKFLSTACGGDLTSDQQSLNLRVPVFKETERWLRSLYHDYLANLYGRVSEYFVGDEQLVVAQLEIDYLQEMIRDVLVFPFEHHPARLFEPAQLKKGSTLYRGIASTDCHLLLPAELVPPLEDHFDDEDLPGMDLPGAGPGRMLLSPYQDQAGAEAKLDELLACGAACVLAGTPTVVRSGANRARCATLLLSKDEPSLTLPDWQWSLNHNILGAYSYEQLVADSEGIPIAARRIEAWRAMATLPLPLALDLLTSHLLLTWNSLDAKVDGKFREHRLGQAFDCLAMVKAARALYLSTPHENDPPVTSPA